VVTEVVIADTKSDLNVYLDISKDGTKKAECCVPSAARPAAEEAPASGCCGPKAAAPCGCEPSAQKDAPCCSPEERVTCCSKPGDPSDAITKTDLNEWVGK